MLVKWADNSVVTAATNFSVLQKKSLDITYCANKFDQTKKLIAGKRNEAVFNKFFE